jgi:FecR protein
MVDQMLNLKNADYVSSSVKPLNRVMDACKRSVALGLALLVFCGAAWAEGVGTVTHLGGVLHAVRADGTSRLLSVKSEVMEGDVLKTEKNTYARIKFVDGGELVLRPESELKVDAYSYKPDQAQGHEDNALLSLTKGGLRSVTGLLGKRNPDKFKVNTATATIGIRGTHFGALLCDNNCGSIPTVSGQPLANGLYTDTAQGTVIVSNGQGSVTVPAGSYSFTAPGTAPQIVPPSQGVQVTMPPSISTSKGTGTGVTSGSTNNTCSP